MILPRFDYVEAETIRKACSLLHQYENAKVLAGGTDLLVEMKNELVSLRCLIDLKKISGLNAIAYNDADGLRLGSLTTIRSIETSSIIRNRYPCLYQGAHVLGSVQIRNRATIGGNICHAVPSGDMLPPLLALGATLRIAGLNGERTVRIEDFFTGVRETVLDKGEILTEIVLLPMAKEARGVYLKHTLRRAMDLALVGVAVVLEWEKEGMECKDIRIALGAVAPTPIRAEEAERTLKGKEIAPELIGKAAQAASEECSPLSDMRASAGYRREMVKVLVKRAIREAFGRRNN